jgi:type I restriction-modification system DNA methylase subunit
VQHMLASLKTDGRMATIMPHGVLFRGGKEKLIREIFINADREYAEGKAQNKLRPEDIEKMDFVYTHKREIPKYSRLVGKSEIVEKHDYNLNIRRYVDNTPEPEPENVQAEKHFRDERLSMKGIPPKLRAITDVYPESKGIDVKIKPISIFDEDFQKQVGKRNRSKTKAAEVEHA